MNRIQLKTAFKRALGFFYFLHIWLYTAWCGSAYLELISVISFFIPPWSLIFLREWLHVIWSAQPLGVPSLLGWWWAYAYSRIKRNILITLCLFALVFTMVFSDVMAYISPYWAPNIDLWHDSVLCLLSLKNVDSQIYSTV